MMSSQTEGSKNKKEKKGKPESETQKMDNKRGNTTHSKMPNFQNEKNNNYKGENVKNKNQDNNNNNSKIKNTVIPGIKLQNNTDKIINFQKNDANIQKSSESLDGDAIKKIQPNPPTTTKAEKSDKFNKVNKGSTTNLAAETKDQKQEEISPQVNQEIITEKNNNNLYIDKKCKTDNMGVKNVNIKNKPPPKSQKQYYQPHGGSMQRYDRKNNMELSNRGNEMNVANEMVQKSFTPPIYQSYSTNMNRYDKCNTFVNRNNKNTFSQSDYNNRRSDMNMVRNVPQRGSRIITSANRRNDYYTPKSSTIQQETGVQNVVSNNDIMRKEQMPGSNVTKMYQYSENINIHKATNVNTVSTTTSSSFISSSPSNYSSISSTLSVISNTSEQLYYEPSSKSDSAANTLSKDLKNMQISDSPQNSICQTAIHPQPLLTTAAPFVPNYNLTNSTSENNYLNNINQNTLIASDGQQNLRNKPSNTPICMTECNHNRLISSPDFYNQNCMNQNQFEIPRGNLPYMNHVVHYNIPMQHTDPSFNNSHYTYLPQQVYHMPQYSTYNPVNPPHPNIMQQAPNTYLNYSTPLVMPEANYTCQYPPSDTTNVNTNYTERQHFFPPTMNSNAYQNMDTLFVQTEQNSTQPSGTNLISNSSQGTEFSPAAYAPQAPITPAQPYLKSDIENRGTNYQETLYTPQMSQNFTKNQRELETDDNNFSPPLISPRQCINYEYPTPNYTNNYQNNTTQSNMHGYCYTASPQHFNNNYYSNDNYQNQTFQNEVPFKSNIGCDNLRAREM